MNADIHRLSNHILHLDIENFFESINGDHIARIIHENKAILSKLSETVPHFV